MVNNVNGMNIFISFLKISSEIPNMYSQKMISHEEDFDKANLVLTVDTQRGLQSLFDYIIYLGIKV